jgi:predicted CXXCH cytochrome family protein
MKCHEETYIEATSVRFIHTVARQECDKCHYIKSNDTKREMTSPSPLMEVVFGIGKISEKGKEYELKVSCSDTSGESSKPVVINTRTGKLLNLPEESFDLKEISDLKVESVKRSIFAKAVISWKTDVPATSEVEYGTSEKDRNRFRSRNTFSRNHKVVLRGLRHKSRYRFSAISRDMNGKTLKSEEHSFDTSAEFGPDQDPASTTETGNKKKLKPEISSVTLFNIGEGEDVFLRMSSNNPVEFNLTMSEMEEERDRPCYGFQQTKTSTIKACIVCHRQDASHPVGVKSGDPDIKIPEELPTIENGVITCVTCHFPHGGKNTYFLRQTIGKEICQKCHTKKYG